MKSLSEKEIRRIEKYRRTIKKLAPRCLYKFSYISFIIISIVAICTIIGVIILPFTIPMAVIYYRVHKYYYLIVSKQNVRDNSTVLEVVEDKKRDRGINEKVELNEREIKISTKKNKRGFISVYKIQVDDVTISELKNRYIALDVETTGLSPQSDKIIEIGAVLFENGEIIRKYSSLVNSEVHIPYKITTINNITNEMIKEAPNEEKVYEELVEFLGDALNENTVICAHNASFDMGFLSETLMRLGYDGKIYYADTLSLSRKLIKGLENYKQDSVAKYFYLTNNQAHRAVSDAEICGKILWNLLQIEEKEQEKRLKNLEKSKPSAEEMEVCAYIQDYIVKNGGDSLWLGFYKNSSNYVDISYLYSIIKLKFAKKGKYIIVEKKAINKMEYKIEPCTMSEGGEDYVRVFFKTPFELEVLCPYIYKLYEDAKKSASDYFKYNKRYELEHKKSLAMMNSLNDLEVARLLECAEQRRHEINNLLVNKVEILSSEDVKSEKQRKELDNKVSSISKKTVGRAILQLNDEMELIKRYETVAQAVRETGVNSKSIRDAAKGIQKHAGGFVWKYEDEREGKNSSV